MNPTPASPPSSMPISYTTPPPNGPVADPSASPSQSPSPSPSESTLSKREQEIFNSHSDGTVNTRKDVKFLQTGVKKWMDQMELPASEETLPNLTEAIVTFAAETKKRSCRGMFLFTEHGSVLVKPGKPNVHLFGAPVGGGPMEEHIYSAFNEDLTLKILHFLYPPHAISDIAKSDLPLPPYPSYDDSSDNGSILGAELSLSEVPNTPVEDETDSDAAIANGGEAMSPRSEAVSDTNGEVYRSEAACGPDAITDEFEDADSFTSYAAFALLPPNQQSSDKRDPMTQEPTSPLQAVMLQNPFLRGIKPVAPQITQQPERGPAANDKEWDPQPKRSFSPTAAAISAESKKAEIEFNTLVKRLVAKVITAAPGGEEKAKALLEGKRAEFTVEEASEILEAEASKLAGIYANIENRHYLPAYQDQLRLSFEGNLPLPPLSEESSAIDAYRMRLSKEGESKSIPLSTEILPQFEKEMLSLVENQMNLRRNIKTIINSTANDKLHDVLKAELTKIGLNNFIGVNKIDSHLATFIFDNQTEIDKPSYRVDNEDGEIPVNVKGTIKRLNSRHSPSLVESEKSRSSSPNRSARRDSST